MPTPRIQLVVPCYQEERRLNTRAFSEFSASHSDVHFVFVDDGSRDRTLAVLQELCAGRPDQMEVMHLERNSGKAEAVRRGLLHAMDQPAPYLAFWDADLATPLDAVPEFVRILDANPQIDMVFGARVKLMGRDIQRRMLRHYLGRIFATVASQVLGLRIYDTQCGAKVFRKSDTLRGMVQAPFCSKWIFDVELLARYIKAKRAAGMADFESVIYEVPLLVWHDIAGSKVKPLDFFKAFGELVRIHFTYRPRKST